MQACGGAPDKFDALSRAKHGYKRFDYALQREKVLFFPVNAQAQPLFFDWQRAILLRVINAGELKNTPVQISAVQIFRRNAHDGRQKRRTHHA